MTDLSWAGPGVAAIRAAQEWCESPGPQTARAARQAAEQLSLELSGAPLLRGIPTSENLSWWSPHHAALLAGGGGGPPSAVELSWAGGFASVLADLHGEHEVRRRMEEEVLRWAFD